MLTDTHTHPYYSENPDIFVKDAVEAGVTKMIMPNVDADSITAMKELAAKYPANFRMAMGLHPTSVKDDWKENLNHIIDEFVHNSDNYLAIGEIGVDLYWDKTYRDRQMQVFDSQLTLARTYGLPVIIHCREALSETLEVLS